MTMNADYAPSRIGPVYFARHALKLGDRIPLSIVQLAARLAVAHVFWKSAQSKLASWPVTQQLFAYEYNLPLIDPGFAASLATVTEMAGAVLLAFGIFARVGALMLLGVAAVIQVFVFPENWGEHLLWASALGLVLARGAGVFSIDYLADRMLRRQR